MMFRTEIEGNVKGITYEMYFKIAGIPSSGQNIPEKFLIKAISIELV